MSLPATIAKAIVETLIGRLAPLFLAAAGADIQAAQEAARQMLAAYHAETPDELSLAAEIISLQFHALEALSDAADPDLSLNRKLRLRGSAVSLSRESHKAQRKLDQLQRARRAGTQPQPANAGAPAPTPPVQKAITVVETAREASNTKPKAETWSQSLQKRMTANRLAKKAQKQQARLAAKIARPEAETIRHAA
jgi:hypothetical protein